MAASKEAIAIVLDVGSGMCQGSANGPTPLQNAKTCIEKVLQRKIFAESKDEVTLILFGTNDTDNLLSEENDGEYANISVVRSLKPVDWDLFEFVKDIEGTTNSSDFVDALVVGMDVLVTQNKGKKVGEQRILLISNFASEVLQDNIKQIILGIKNTNFQLNVIGPKCYGNDDEEEDGPAVHPVEGKSVANPKSEQIIGKILKEVNGESFTFDEALPALTYYQKKKVVSAVWNADMEVTPTLVLPLCGYIKVTQHKVKPWKTAYAQDPEAKIIRETSFHLNDNVQTEVDKDEIEEGFRYGSSIIPFTKDDRANMEYQTGLKGLKVLGFTKREHVKRHHYMGDKTQYFVAPKDNEPVQMALSALIQALHETDQVAIVRYAYSPRSAPRVGFMSPLTKPNYECLVFIQLPFSEDIRQYEFRPLNTHKKHIPNSDQLKAVDDLIDTMDLLRAEVDSEGNREEAFKSKDLPNPHLQRLYQCLQHRAFHPGEPLPPMPEHLPAKLLPSTELVNLAKPALASLKRFFPIKEEVKSDSKATGASMFQNGDTGASDEPAAKKLKANVTNNVSSLVVGNTVTQVGSINPVENFKQLVSQGSIAFTEVCQQLETVIRQLLDDPRDALHAKAVDCIKAYREEAVKIGNCASYNAFLQSMKSSLLVQNKTAWQKIVSGQLQLVSVGECPRGGVAQEVISQFLVVSAGGPAKDTPKDIEPDADDLLSEMDL